MQNLFVQLLEALSNPDFHASEFSLIRNSSPPSELLCKRKPFLLLIRRMEILFSGVKFPFLGHKGETFIRCASVKALSIHSRNLSLPLPRTAHWRNAIVALSLELCLSLLAFNHYPFASTVLSIGSLVVCCVFVSVSRPSTVPCRLCYRFAGYCFNEYLLFLYFEC